MLENNGVRHCLSIIFLAALIFAAAGQCGAASREDVPVNRLSVVVDPKGHSVQGVSTISLPATHDVTIDLAGLSIFSVKVNGVPFEAGASPPSITFKSDGFPDEVSILFEKKIEELPAFDRESNPGVISGDSITTEGVFLSSGWYPSVRGGSIISLRAVLPKGWSAVSEADEIETASAPDGRPEFSFLFPHEINYIHLVASKYEVRKETYGGIDIYTYFSADDGRMSKTYMRYAGQYISTFEKILGRFPFRRFSIVETPFPAGYSMPTFTLLGRDVIRLPFMAETAFGHEVLHQWLGNMVFPDGGDGNWSEGLTTYLADHAGEELKGKGWEYRKQMLVNFMSYVRDENDFPVRSFSSRSDQASAAVGYGKTAMFFHMLKNEVGEKAFYDSLRNLVREFAFRPASWNDIREVFEKVSGKSLDLFFGQWIEQKGAPYITLGNPTLRYMGDKAIVDFEVSVTGGGYRFDLPVKIKTAEGEDRRIFSLTGAKNFFSFETSGEPSEIALDPDCDVFRRLTDDERTPSVSALLGSKKVVFVFPSDEEERFSDVKKYLLGRGYLMKKESEVGYDDLRSSSLILFGSGNAVVRRLFGGGEKSDDDYSVVMRENPFNKNGVAALVEGRNMDSVRYLRLISHYGKYGRLSFRDGKNSLKTVIESRRGVAASLASDIFGVEPSRAVKLDRVAELVADKDIIYVGEVHDRFAHHRAQLEMIRKLYRKNGGKVAVGMEMFQKPSQKALDDYVSGAIGEKEFLKKSEYFKRWSMDYNLYREILLYAREHSIPVVALNIEKEIVSKVSREGLYSLTAEELAKIPRDMDMSDSEYKARLKGYFERHGGVEGRNFDFFYQAQILWDEAMAHNINEFMSSHPGYKMVVVAGGGHMAFGSGIPSRVYRLNGRGYSIVMNNAEDLEENVADFVLFSEPLGYVESPKLMVQMKEEGGRLRVLDFPSGSVSEKAGVKKDDLLISVDGEKISTVDDLRILLLYRKKGDIVKVRVLRERFLFGPKETEIDVTL